MAWRCSGSSLLELVNNLKASKIIQSDVIYGSMLAIDRKLYCRKSDAQFAYADSPLSIGHGVTISAPHMHAHCLELLKDHLKPGMRALDVGSGSGYLVACMQHMMVDPALDAEKNGKTFGVEYIKEIYEQSVINLKSDSFAGPLLGNCIQVKQGDGWQGWKEHGPFNAIHVGAAASNVPQALLDQLAKPGRMVIPVGTYSQNLMVIDKDDKGNITQFAAFGVVYVPLVNPSNYA